MSRMKSIEAVTTVAAETAAAAERVADAVKQGAADAAIAFQQAQPKVKVDMDNVMKTAEEFVQFGQGNLEAFVKSGQIFAAGLQDISRQVAENARSTFDETVATFKALSGVKSLKEAVDLQTQLTRTTVEKTLAETGRLTEASLKLAEQAYAPITARFTLAVEKFSKAA